MKPIELYPIKKCENCGEDYRQKRPSARFCHNRCRVAFSRRKAEEKRDFSNEEMYRVASRDAIAAEISASKAREKADMLRGIAEKLRLAI